MSSIVALLLLAHTATAEYDQRVITTLKYSRYIVKPTVVSGETVSSGQIPYIVSLKESIDKVQRKTLWRNICGGSIINPSKILTAAHCFENNDFYYARNPYELRLVAGDLRNDIVHDGQEETTDRGQWRTIKDVILHKDFNFPNHDIALVFISIPWNLTSYVDTIPVATRVSDYPVYCVSSGYGRTSHGLRDNISPVLLVARIEVISRWRCSIWWEMNMNSFICTDSAVTDVARGDSGGPLACKGTDDPNERSGKQLLVGVVSGKNFDKTTLYTRVSAYRDWIARGGCGKLYGELYVMIIALVLIYLLFVERAVDEYTSQFVNSDLCASEGT